MKNGESWLDPLFVNCWSAPPGSTEAIAFSCESESWLLILFVGLQSNLPRINRGDHLFMWKLTVDHLCQSLICPSPGSTEVITFSHESEGWLDPHFVICRSIPRINRGNCLFTWKWKLTIEPLSQLLIHPLPGSTEVTAFSYETKVDCWSSLCQSLIHPQDQQWWLPFHVKVDCWSSLCRSLICPQDHQRQLPFHMQRQLPFHMQRWSPFHMQTVDPLCVNCKQ